MVYRDYRRHAAARHLSFELGFEQFLHLTRQRCAYCGAPPGNVARPSRNRPEFMYTGIDRQENSLGYTVENCVPCCAQCNSIKRGLPYAAWEQWLDRVARYYKEGRARRLWQPSPVATCAVG